MVHGLFSHSGVRDCPARAPRKPQLRPRPRHGLRAGGTINSVVPDAYTGGYRSCRVEKGAGIRVRDKYDSDLGSTRPGEEPVDEGEIEDAVDVAILKLVTGNGHALWAYDSAAVAKQFLGVLVLYGLIFSRNTFISTYTIHLHSPIHFSILFTPYYIPPPNYGQISIQKSDSEGLP